MSLQASFNFDILGVRQPLAISKQTSERRLGSLRSATIALAALFCISSQATAQGFPGKVDLLLLSSGDGSSGFVLNGVDINDLSGTSVSVVGDINADGIEDLLIGAPRATEGPVPTGGVNLGESYVLFGREAGTGFPAVIELASLASGDGSMGFVLRGEPTGTSLKDGSSIVAGEASSGGDLNGDGIDDLIIGGVDLAYTAPDRDSVYVVYGRSAVSGGFPPVFELASLLTGDGISGFVFRGAGRLPTQMGDLNGDGIDDLYAAAVGEFANSYVVFGRSAAVGGFPAEFDSEWIIDSEEDQSRGFNIGITLEFDSSGYAADIGDINGDGIDDLIFSAPAAQPDNREAAGEVFVIYGRDAAADNFPERVSLVGLGRESNDLGFTLLGSTEGDVSGRGIGVGDINGDGIDDIIIGAPGVDPGGRKNAGSTYVVYGREGDRGVFPFAFELSSLADGDGSAGFVVNGIETQDQSGDTVAIGDVNDDGVKDIVVGAKSTDRSAGQAYVVFGRNAAAGRFPAEFELSSLAEGNGSVGFVLDGLDPIENVSSPIDRSGKSLGAGDLNGDGVDDVILGDSRASLGDLEHAGITYVVFGLPNEN